MVSNKNAIDYIKRFEIFKANNIFSKRIGELYVIYSYGEHYPMYLYKNDQWYGNELDPSPTTKKHKTIANPGNVTWISHIKMKELCQKNSY